MSMPLSNLVIFSFGMMFVRWLDGNDYDDERKIYNDVKVCKHYKIKSVKIRMCLRRLFYFRIA